MASLIALLRGVNVGGKTLKMEELRESLGALGLNDVRTYLQSGNALFTSRSSGQALAQRIEERIKTDFGLDVPVTLKTSTDLGRIVRVNPFVRERGMDLAKLHVTFLAEAPTKAAMQKLEALPVGDDQLSHSGTEVFLYCPNGYGRSKLTNQAIERVLAVSATTRNWATVTKLYELASETAT